MKHLPGTKSSNDKLPSFLDSNDPAVSLDDPATHDATTEVAGDAATTVNDCEASDGRNDEATPATDRSDDLTVERVPDERRKPRSRAVAPSRPGNGSLFAGGALLVFALTLAVLQGRDGSSIDLGRFGIDPQSLFVVGTILFATGMTRRRLSGLQQRLDETLGNNTDSTSSLREGLQFLVESQHASNERPPAAGEELQHVLVALQRQDEKISNLTKAIKMYGKPLMEISGQGTEITGSLAQTKAAVEAGNDTAQKAFTRLEAQLRSNGASKEIADLADIVLKVSATLETMQKKGNTAPSLEPLQQQVGRLEVSVAAIGQRLENSEMQKSLMRLEDTTQKARDEVQVLLRGEGLQKATTQLQDRLEKATGRLSDGLNQMRDGHLGGLETSMREIQREVSGIATTMAQLQAAVKNGGRPGAAAAPAPAAPAATPAPERAPTPAPVPATPGGEPASSGGYHTGSRASSSKNVLGAIAKLKQMKS